MLTHRFLRPTLSRSVGSVADSSACSRARASLQAAGPSPMKALRVGCGVTERRGRQIADCASLHKNTLWVPNPLLPWLPPQQWVLPQSRAQLMAQAHVPCEGKFAPNLGAAIEACPPAPNPGKSGFLFLLWTQIQSFKLKAASAALCRANQPDGKGLKVV